MASEVGICNRALQKLGASRITALTDDTANARACNVAYEPVRDAELRRHPWSFALARTTLAALAAAPDFGFSYQFQLPADFLRLHPDYEYRAETDWQIEGRRLLTNDGDTIYLRYVRRVTDPNQFDALFIEALAAKLAFEICEELTGSQGRADRLVNEYQRTIRDARKVNAIEKVSAEIPEDTWLTVRR